MLLVAYILCCGTYVEHRSGHRCRSLLLCCCFLPSATWYSAAVMFCPLIHEIEAQIRRLYFIMCMRCASSRGLWRGWCLDFAVPIKYQLWCTRWPHVFSRNTQHYTSAPHTYFMYEYPRGICDTRYRIWHVEEVSNQFINVENTNTSCLVTARQVPNVRSILSYNRTQPHRELYQEQYRYVSYMAGLNHLRIVLIN